VRRRVQHRRGFTLIEALAAIAVMLIVIPVLLQGFMIAAAIAEKTRQMAEATALAQSTMDEQLATLEWMQGPQSGETQIGPTAYRWDTSLNVYESEVNVQTFTVSVTWINRGKQSEVKLDSIVFTPGSTVTSQDTTTPLGGGLP
jgi:prepilin-type N-terminal cleavage/methylation domain-containing protein